MPPHAEMRDPGTWSTIAFVVIVLTVVAATVTAVYRAHLADGPALARRRRGQAIAVAAGLLALTAMLAVSGLLSRAAGTMALIAYPATVNVAAIAVALSPLGRRLATRTPLWALIGFQAFRLPLELVLHAFYEAGTLPIQMTYDGENFDIVTGIAALVVGWAVYRGWFPRVLAWAFSLVGLVLLIRVVRIAILSSPWPLRSYMEDPAVLLMFYAPFTWILPFCVGGALLGHLLLLRALLTRPVVAA